MRKSPGVASLKGTFIGLIFQIDGFLKSGNALPHLACVRQAMQTLWPFISLLGIPADVITWFSTECHCVAGRPFTKWVFGFHLEFIAEGGEKENNILQK